uniref:Uncharacterized protein n=1 Tax=Ixodes ricinus TaxID=34613 RepID=A0A6B0V7V9_IXORI
MVQVTKTQAVIRLAMAALIAGPSAFGLHKHLSLTVPWLWNEHSLNQTRFPGGRIPHHASIHSNYVVPRQQSIWTICSRFLCHRDDRDTGMLLVEWRHEKPVPRQEQQCHGHRDQVVPDAGTVDFQLLPGSQHRHLVLRQVHERPREDAEHKKATTLDPHIFPNSSQGMTKLVKDAANHQRRNVVENVRDGKVDSWHRRLEDLHFWLPGRCASRHAHGAGGQDPDGWRDGQDADGGSQREPPVQKAGLLSAQLVVHAGGRRQHLVHRASRLGPGHQRHEHVSKRSDREARSADPRACDARNQPSHL